MGWSGDRLELSFFCYDLVCFCDGYSQQCDFSGT